MAQSGILTSIKIVYYRLFAALYGWAGSYASVAMVNSSWTHDHVVSIWRVRCDCDCDGTVTVTAL